MTRSVTPLVAGLACVLALAGCGSPSSSPSPSPSSSTPSAPTGGADTPAGPAVPPAAQGTSREAAQAFVQHWVDTLNSATASGETEALEGLAAKECTTCADFARTLDRIYEAGGHVESKGWHLDSAVPLADQPEDEPAFQLALTLEPQKVYETATSKPQKYPGGSQPARIFLTRQGDRWLVQRLDI